MGIISPNLVKKKRKELELTQLELAKKAGVSQSIIAKIESSRLNPTYTIIEQISRALSENTKSAQDIMKKNIIRSSGDRKQDIELMKKKNVSQLVVSTNQVVSERSLLQEKEFEEVPSIPHLASIDSVRQLLFSYQCVTVVKAGKVIGIITRSDML